MLFPLLGHIPSSCILFISVDGGWSEFGEWGECSKPCGGGEQSRSRTCTNPPPAPGGVECSGDDKETQACNDHPCPGKRTTFLGTMRSIYLGEEMTIIGNTFFQSTVVGASLGTGASVARIAVAENSREVGLAPIPRRPMVACSALGTTRRLSRVIPNLARVSGPVVSHVLCTILTCTSPFISVDGGWSEFGQWGECSKPCDGGQQSRSRTCTNPPPAHGGAQCPGDEKETQPCNLQPCPGKRTVFLINVRDIDLDGDVTMLGNTSFQSTVVGLSLETGASVARIAVEENNREVGLAPIPRQPMVAHSALGMTKRRKRATPILARVSGRFCSEPGCLPCWRCDSAGNFFSVDGGWSGFGDWGECSKPCGGGEQSRSRTCTNPPPAHGGAQCPGDDKETQPCNSQPCPGKRRMFLSTMRDIDLGEEVTILGNTFFQSTVAGVSLGTGASAASRVVAENNREVGFAPIPRRLMVARSALGTTRRLSRVIPNLARVSEECSSQPWGLLTLVKSWQYLEILFFSRRWLEWVWGLGRVQRAVWWRRTIEKSDLHQSPASPWWRTVLWGRQGDASV